MSTGATCPPRDLLRRSLDPDDSLPETERRWIEDHIDRCDRGCKAVIETLLRGMTLVSGTAPTRAAAVSKPAEPPPPPSIPGYEIVGELGRGGMAVVYKARQVALNRLVALKMVRAGAHATAEELGRFRTEAEAVAALRHPNVVQIYEIGAHDGCPYLALEFVDGGSLSERLARERPRPRQAAELVETLARAVHFAHQQGIIHRDLKPANVLLAADGTPKVADFGLAKRLEGSLDQTQTGQILGSPNYMAPEQAGEGATPVGTLADVYALGAILYSMLTGRPPFVGPTPWYVMGQVRTAEPAPPRRLAPQTPADLETICLKCLQKDPQRRYASAAALADDLRRYLAGEPVRARPIRDWERAWKWIKRRPVVSGLAAALLLAVAAGSVASWLFAVNAERAAANARTERDRADSEKQAAEAREAETKAVLDFVENRIFAAARPKDQAGGLGYDVKLRDAVKQALQFVDNSFRDRPLIEARLRTTMGTSFLYLGDPSTAAEQYRRARELLAAKLGPDHINTLISMNNLALSYADLGRLDDALKLREETLALQKAKLGPDHPHTLRTMMGLASSYAALGRHADALKLCEETLALKTAKLGRDHPDTLKSMNNLANSYDDLGRHADALKLYAETLALKKAKLGPDHPDTLGTMGNLAISYAALGRHADAVKLYEETLALQKAKLGPDHPDTLVTMGNLASSYDALGRHADTVKLFEETLALQKAKLGPDHPDTLRSMHNLAVSYYYVGRHASALKLHEETLALRKAKLGPDHPATIFSMWGLIQSLVSLNRGSEAVPIIDECLKRAAGKVVDPKLVPGVMDLRLRHFEKGKDAAGCRTTAEMWEKLNRTDVDSLYTAACYRAVTAAGENTPGANATGLAPDDADRAMDWLRSALAAGYRDIPNLVKDPDLAALRQRRDYAALLWDIADVPAASTVGQ